MASETLIPPKRSGLSRATVEALTGYLFILPFVIVLGLFVFIAMIYTLYISFTDLKFFNAPQFIGLDQYDRVLHNDLFWTAVKNTLLFSAVVVFCQTWLALLLAVLLNAKIRGQRFFRVAWYAPSVTSSVVVSLIFVWIFKPTGILNYILSSLFGWAGFEPVGWLTDPNAHTALPALMLLNIFTTAPTFMIFFLAALQDVPPEVYEAGNLDGATGWRQFWYLTVPMLRPIIFLVVVLGTIGTLQVFDQVYIMTEGGPDDQTTTINYLIYTAAFKGSSKIAYASAMAVILFVMIFALYLVQQRLIGSEDKDTR
jgi:multiple sugar transport system permease protein